MRPCTTLSSRSGARLLRVRVQNLIVSVSTLISVHTLIRLPLPQLACHCFSPANPQSNQWRPLPPCSPRADGHEHPARRSQSSGSWCLVRGPDATPSTSSRCSRAGRAQGGHWCPARRGGPQSRGADAGALGAHRVPLSASKQQEGCV